jgi:hypothetical protein
MALETGDLRSNEVRRSEVGPMQEQLFWGGIKSRKKRKRGCWRWRWVLAVGGCVVVGD